jgi:hypothetical protein
LREYGFFFTDGCTFFTTFITSGIGTGITPFFQTGFLPTERF